jgi:glycine dehydrogenase
MLMQSALPLADLENPSEFRPATSASAPKTKPHAERRRRRLAPRADRRIVPAASRAPRHGPARAGDRGRRAGRAQGHRRKNQILRSFIGQGYYGTHTPGVILRNILENPAWYTAYTPYQAEISQGRMEALVNFQTMVCDLTGMPIANASMLDEATAAAEAMTLAKRSVKSKANTIWWPATATRRPSRSSRPAPRRWASRWWWPQRAEWAAALAGDYFAAVASTPAPAAVRDWRRRATAHAKQAAFIVAADLLALTLLRPANGRRHRGRQHPALRHAHGRGRPARRLHGLPRRIQALHARPPGGRQRGRHGKPAYRLALQTREQHIRREKATSNICTAQVLPAVMASMYAVYHGPQGLKRIAQRVARYTAILAAGLQQLGFAPVTTAPSTP